MLKPNSLFTLYKSILVLLFLTNCNTISYYDQQSYTNVVSCKVDALFVMSKATESYQSHTQDLDELKKELDKAYTYDINRRLNTVTIKMWDKLRDPNSQLLGGFLKEWSEDDKLLPKYIERKKDQIGQAFDTIIQLEAGKRKNAN